LEFDHEFLAGSLSRSQFHRALKPRMPEKDSVYARGAGRAPRALVDRINADIHTGLADSEAQKRLPLSLSRPSLMHATDFALCAGECGAPGASD
jgi:hypothetical protein